MKKYLAILLGIVLSIAMFAGCTSEPPAPADTAENAADAAADSAPADASAAQETPAGDLKLAWYAPAPHPYFDEVRQGVDLFVSEQGVEVIMQIGPDWTQASENEKVEALVAQGVNALSIYPCDAAGANGLYEEITARGVDVINFGTDTERPNTVSFSVGTDVKQAAFDAAEAVIKMMGEEGNIINVLEVLEDPNTALRKEGVEEAVAKYPNVTIIQEVAGIKTQEEAVSKIESVLSANAGQVNGIVCTGFVTSVGAAQTLSDYYQKQGTDQKIYAIGMDTDPDVIKAIEEGTLDATVAQNPIGHGYISCMLLKYLNEGYTVKEGQYFVNAGNAIVTKDNLATYAEDIDKVTQEILGRLESEYLTK